MVSVTVRPVAEGVVAALVGDDEDVGVEVSHFVVAAVRGYGEGREEIEKIKIMEAYALL